MIPPMKYERAHPAIFTSSITKDIYVIGGSDAAGNEISCIEKFDVKTGIGKPFVILVSLVLQVKV